MPSQLDELLRRVSDEIDTEHCQRVDVRYRRALTWEPVDYPPLVVYATWPATMQLPPPWDRFEHFPYGTAFDHPEMMLQNQLLDRVVPGLVLKDDGPLAIRADHGAIQVAGVLGGRWVLTGDNSPWIEPIQSRDVLRQIATDRTSIDLEGGNLKLSLETLRFYHEKLKQFPPCGDWIQVSMPDLQGPMDTAEQLWGSEMFVGFYESPDLVASLMARIVDTMLVLAETYRPLTVDRLDPVGNTQHGYVFPGRLLLRGDSCIMISPQMYAEQVRPHDARLLRDIGGGSIHFCGNGEHLIPAMLAIEQLRGLDFGDSFKMNLGSIYARCAERRVAITNLNLPREDMISQKAHKDYPTGAVMRYQTRSIEDAREVLTAWHHSGAYA